MPGKRPSFTTASPWQMPQASTLMRTSVSLGSGISFWTSSNSAPGAATCTAFINGISYLRGWDGLLILSGPGFLGRQMFFQAGFILFRCRLQRDFAQQGNQLFGFPVAQTFQ